MRRRLIAGALIAGACSIACVPLFIPNSSSGQEQQTGGVTPSLALPPAPVQPVEGRQSGGPGMDLSVFHRGSHVEQLDRTSPLSHGLKLPRRDCRDTHFILTYDFSSWAPQSSPIKV
ncbi:MAG: hypothetical protein WBX00_27975 [Isosphaeraceae bacterium]